MGTSNPHHNLHFICLKCRIGFKSMQETLKCPHCKKEMIEVSVAFRIPKKTDKKEWKKVTKEINKGNRFWSRWWVR